MTLYTIKSISSEGEWYLVNGRRKHKAFWQHKDRCAPSTLFKSIRDSNRSLTKLLNQMPEYRVDIFIPVRIEWNDEHSCYDFKEIWRLKK